MSASTVSARFDVALWRNLDVSLRSVDRLMRKKLKDQPVSVIECFILLALRDNDGILASQLATAVGRAPTSFTPNLDSLEKKLLIVRGDDERDRRAVRVQLTPKAKMLLNELDTVLSDVEQEIRSRFSNTDYEAFMRVLDGLKKL